MRNCKNIITSILLISLVGVYLLPDVGFCPKDMEEHHHGNCKDGMMKHDESSKEETKTKNTAAFDVKRNCIEIQNDTDYVAPDQSTIKLSVRQLTIVVSFISINYELPEQEFFITPDPLCNSGPPLPSNSLHGPPFV